MNKGCVSRNWPFITTAWLSMTIPIAMGSITTISWIYMTILMLNDLVFMITQVFVGMEEWIIDWWWTPVGVVRSILLLIWLLSCWTRWLGHWSIPIRVVRFACSIDGIAQISFERYIIGAQCGTIWKFYPLGGGLTQGMRLLTLIKFFLWPNCGVIDSNSSRKVITSRSVYELLI